MVSNEMPATLPTALCGKVWLSWGLTLGPEVSMRLNGRLCYCTQMCVKISRDCGLDVLTMQRDRLQKRYLLFWDVFFFVLFCLEYRIALISFFRDLYLFAIFKMHNSTEVETWIQPICHKTQGCFTSVEWSGATEDGVFTSSLAYFSGSIWAVLPHLAVSVLSRVMSFGMRNRCVWNVQITPLSFSTLPPTPPHASPNPVSVFYDKANGGGWAVKTQGASKVSKYKSAV